jgi:hypothetical protein
MQQRKEIVFPALIFSSIALQILICAVVALIFKDAIRVFVQRDDGRSNIPNWATKILNWSSTKLKWLSDTTEWLTNHVGCVRRHLRGTRGLENRSSEVPLIPMDTLDNGTSSEWASQTVERVAEAGTSDSHV